MEAMALVPDCADRGPLRALSVAGCDSKFFERDRALITRLLDLHFGEDALAGGLKALLGTTDDAEPWLLIANAANAVQEPVPAEPKPPTRLTAPEQALYRVLRARPQSRLEQEFRAPETVREALAAWHGNTVE